MWFSSRSHNRQPSALRESRYAQGPSRRRADFRPGPSALECHQLLSTPPDPVRERCRRSNVLTAAVNLFWKALSASAVIAPVLGLMWVNMTWRGSSAEAPAPEGPPGSGIVVKIEVTAIWIPQALRDLARRQGGTPGDCSIEDVQLYLARNGWGDAWYALTCWECDPTGGSAEITQIKWLSESAAHLEELQAVMATAAGKPPWFEDGRFSHTRVELIPDSFQAVDAHSEIIRLMADLVAGDKSLRAGAMDSPRRTE